MGFASDGEAMMHLPRQPPVSRSYPYANVRREPPHEQ
jgi:hypothetical protein